MTPGALTVMLAAGVVLLALAGPTLVRRAAPALVRFPRLAIVLLSGGALAWVVAALALGLTLLPDGAAAFCRRLLAALTPFASHAQTVSPSALVVVALPVGAALVLGVTITRQAVRRSQSSRGAADALLRGTQQRVLHGHRVSVVDTEHPFALAFPARHGGIVLSSGAVATLRDDELAAVLAHERAHLNQHHHAVSTLVDSIAAVLGWVPLVAAVADALPHYLEIAADDQARRHAGTPALVSALVTLGERSGPSPTTRAGATALHAAGPERVRHLVRPVEGAAGALPALAAAAAFATLAVVGLTVHVPYVAAAVTGCA